MKTKTALCAIAALACVLLVACRKSANQTPPTVVHSYTVRGEVVDVPVAGDPRTDLMIHHEAIPEFKGEKGVVGMDTMTMPFPISEGFELGPIAKGDKVEVTFEVVMDTKKDALLDWVTVKVDKLPADTVLNFTPLKGAGG